MLSFFRENEKSNNDEDKGSVLLQGQKTENIKFMNNGLIHIYLSMKETAENDSDDLLNASYKILTMEADKYFIGLTDSLSMGEYVFSYVLSGRDSIKNYKSIDNKVFEPEIDNTSAIACAKVHSAAKLVSSLYSSFTGLLEFNNKLDKLLGCATAYFWYFKEINNVSYNPRCKLVLDGANNYNLLKSGNVKLSNNFSGKNFEQCQNIGFDVCIPASVNLDIEKIQYFQCLSQIEQNVVNNFITAHHCLNDYHCKEAAHSIVQLKDSFKCEFDRTKQLLSQFFSEKEGGLITELIRIFVEAAHGSIGAGAIWGLIDYIANKYKEAITCFESKFDISLGIGLDKLNTFLSSFKPDDSANEIAIRQCIYDELDGGFDRILKFSDLNREEIDLLKYQMTMFKEVDNKSNLEFMPLDSRRQITSAFFNLYEAVIKRALRENINDKAIDMFLEFGLIDSTLVTDQQILGLNNLLDIYKNDSNVYSVKRWLTKVYNKEKSPSINDLGIDYEQTLKEKKVKSLFTVNKTNENTDTGERRLNYEIMNMFKTSHKVCYGQISSYLPILHKDMLPDDIPKVAVTAEKVSDSLQNILNIDFSAFHREVFYTGSKQAFMKELIMKQVIPDIILVPTVGTRAIMWQEMSGRSKVTPGRFILPIFTWEDLNALFLKLVGSYRWELCRAMMGPRWNDISYKSLTSEYDDYIQEYKKNRNLSEDTKERIKIQIKKHHNSLKDMFSADYEAWMKYEAKGIRKVNKEVRSVLYKYCPFERSMREELNKQIAFSEIAGQFENERRKIARELENRYAQYVKQGHILEPELEENLKYYKEL